MTAVKDLKYARKIFPNLYFNLQYKMGQDFLDRQ